MRQLVTSLFLPRPSLMKPRLEDECQHLPALRLVLGQYLLSPLSLAQLGRDFSLCSRGRLGCICLVLPGLAAAAGYILPLVAGLLTGLIFLNSSSECSSKGNWRKVKFHNVL